MIYTYISYSISYSMNTNFEFLLIIINIGYMVLLKKKESGKSGEFNVVCISIVHTQVLTNKIRYLYILVI